jgi:malate dehydrogenase
MLASKTGSHVSDVDGVIIWGNHSATQVPDLAHATVKGQAALDLVSPDWYASEFIPAVQQRGAAIITARGASSAASAASAAIDHVRDWMLGSPAGKWVSMGVASNGSYGIDEGVVYSYPVTCKAGSYTIVENLDINGDCRQRMTASHEELLEERDGVAELL